MLETKVIPLFYEANPQTAIQLVDACYAGGARVIEFTNRGDQAEVVFAQLIAHCRTNCPDLALGVGSISTVDQVGRFADLGAHFLISPFLDEAIAKASKQRNLMWTGGCGTLTEMQTAYNWGVPIVKAFPGSTLGPAFIKAVKAPCPWIQIMPTGGVKPEQENLHNWFTAGASCVGMGSRLFVKDQAGNFDYQKISSLLQFSIQTAKEITNKSV